MPVIGGPEVFELVPDARPRRGVSCVNLGPDDKFVFDAIHFWLMLQKGRSLAQWDVFSFILAEALSNKESPLYRANLFPEEEERKP